MYDNFCIHLPLDGHLGYFHILLLLILCDPMDRSPPGSSVHILAILKSAAMNMGVQGSLSVMVFSGYMPGSGIAELYDSSIPSFLKNLHTVLHSGCIHLHSHQ